MLLHISSAVFSLLLLLFRLLLVLVLPFVLLPNDGEVERDRRGRAGRAGALLLTVAAFGGPDGSQKRLRPHKNRRGRIN